MLSGNIRPIYGSGLALSNQSARSCRLEPLQEVNRQHMAYTIDFATATSDQIETALCKRLESIRLSRNITQQQLAEEAGVSTRTIRRLEKGQGISLDTFIRILTALRIQHSLESLLPDPTVRPIERVGLGTGERKRARPVPVSQTHPAWSWGDGEDEHEQ
jgi:transcriptional regulator with XRE-family HTH domain